jgi:hypothetical protein
MNRGGERKQRKSIVTVVVIFLAILGCILLCLYIGWRLFLAMGRSMAECPSEYDVMAWLDENTNGIFEVGEPPLPDVVFFAGLDTPDPPRSDVTAISDRNGKAQLHFGMMNVNMMTEYGKIMKISTEIPPGYTITTPISYTAEVCEGGTTYYFGFIPQPGLEPEP